MQNLAVDNQLPGIYPKEQSTPSVRIDTFPDNQTLYNGRMWQNPYFEIRENQFLFSQMFLPGSVTMRGTSFSHVSIRYDIFNDEIQIPYYSGGIIQLNKELVDSFSIVFSGKEYRFVSIPADSSGGPTGYFNLLYHGTSELLVRYIKKIEKLSVEGKFDGFYELHKIFIKKDNQFHPIRKKRDAVILASDKRAARKFLRSSGYDISKNEPESFLPLIQFIDRRGQ